MKNHWAGLTLFVDNPEVDMDNNISERMLRGPVLGRKNYYGTRIHWASELSAAMFSIVQTPSEFEAICYNGHYCFKTRMILSIEVSSILGPG